MANSVRSRKCDTRLDGIDGIEPLSISVDRHVRAAEGSSVQGRLISAETGRARKPSNATCLRMNRISERLLTERGNHKEV